MWEIVSNFVAFLENLNFTLFQFILRYFVHFFEGKRYSFSRCFALEIATTLLSHSDMKSGN